MIRIAALAMVAAMTIAACSSAAAPTPQIIYVTPAPATPAPTPTPTPAATPTPTPIPTLPPPPVDPNLGKVAFGTHFNASTLLIDKGSMTFSRTANQVCWSAGLSEPPKHTTVREVIVKVGSGGVESQVWSRNDSVSNAAYTLWANCEPFEAYVGYMKGSYMLRFLDGVATLAEGRFVLK